MGLAQLAKAERMWARRRDIAQQYNAAFAGQPHLCVPRDRADCRHAWHLYMLRLNPERLPGLAALPADAAGAAGAAGAPGAAEGAGAADAAGLAGAADAAAGAENLDGQVRAGFVRELKRRCIGASVHFIPLHLHPYYRETYGYRPDDFPVASREYRREVSLPIYSRMDDQDVRDVIDAVLDIVQTHGA
jgi:dTDP-4-amino-4,6-dideoxygalactose transaminase